MLDIRGTVCWLLIAVAAPALGDVTYVIVGLDETLTENVLSHVDTVQFGPRARLRPRDHDKVIDVRNFGLMGAIELAPREGAPGARGLEIHKHCFWNEDLVVRNGMDILQISPFLNSRLDDWNMAFDKIRRIIDAID